ncbi:MAG TPA: hypothetical protein VF644_05670, partial [Pyrinomonadaceae bacterium]
MGKVCLYFALFSLVFTVTAASAQTRQRVIDNFDLASGVKVYVPETSKPVVKTQKKSNAQQTSKNRTVIPIVMTGTSWQQQPAARMSFNKSLGSFTT